MTRRSRLFIGIEAEGSPVRFTLLGGGHGAEPQFFDAQQAVIVGIEGNARVVFGRHAQHFHGDVLQREQQFGAVGEQQIHVGPVNFTITSGVSNSSAGRRHPLTIESRSKPAMSG